jgi:hypothetical protein
VYPITGSGNHSNLSGEATCKTMLATIVQHSTHNCSSHANKRLRHRYPFPPSSHPSLHISATVTSLSKHNSNNLPNQVFNEVPSIQLSNQNKVFSLSPTLFSTLSPNHLPTPTLFPNQILLISCHQLEALLPPLSTWPSLNPYLAANTLNHRLSGSYAATSNTICQKRNIKLFHSADP